MTTTDRIQQLVSLIEIQEAGIKDLWDRFQHETRLYLNAETDSEEQCTRSADAGAAYRKAKVILQQLRAELTMLRVTAGHSRFDRNHPERNITTCTHTR